MKIKDLNDQDLAKLIENRWKSSETVWDVVLKTTPINLRFYKSNPEWLENLPRKQPRVRTNRIFVNTEAVINALIANPPKPTILASRDTPKARDLAQAQEKYFARKYQDLNVKEVLRKGLRNLYFSRFIVLKPYWDSKINDFNVSARDPMKIRVQKNATKEEDSEFVIEEVPDFLIALMQRFPSKKAEIMKEAGYTDETQITIINPEVTYKEAWIRDYVVFKYGNLILGKVPNPYWDWDGILVTEEEEQSLGQAEDADARRAILLTVKTDQDSRKQAQVQQLASMQAPQVPVDPANPVPQAAPMPAPAPMGAMPQPGMETAPTGQTGDLPLNDYQENPVSYNSYYFNHFSQPRKPYIFATAFNNENTPIGQTDMITQAIPLQVDADETKRNITRNARFMNGVWKIDAEVMGKADAQRLDTETGGVIWGKGVKDGALRETGAPLPQTVFDNYLDDLREIDNIMAASSAFRGEREGVETKAGRLALIDQSYLRLNEFVQIVDYVNYELFNWFYQLAKVRYTEHHYAKVMGEDQALEVLTIMQDDFVDGTEVKVIGGKTLPEDREFRYQQAQEDAAKGLIAPQDYFTAAGYNNPMELAKNKVLYDLNAAKSVGVTDEELQAYTPPAQKEEKPPSVSIKYEDLPPDAQLQLLAQIGIQADPEILIAEKMADQKKEQDSAELERANADRDFELNRVGLEAKNQPPAKKEKK